MRPVRLHTSCGCNGRNACVALSGRSGCRPFDTLCERRQLDLCLGRAAPVTPHHGATGSSCGKPSKRCAAASGPRTHALSALSCALTRCGASLCGHRYLYVSCRARSRPRPDRPRHGHRRRCRRRRRRRRHSPRVRLMRLRSSRHFQRVRTCVMGMSCSELPEAMGGSGAAPAGSSLPRRASGA